MAKKAIAKAIDRIGNEMELLFKYSCEKKETIQITLKNDKVYVGWVELLPKPSHSTFIRLVPVLSGYRDHTKRFHVTTNYSYVYSEYIKSIKEAKSEEEIDELETTIVIKLDEIISAHLFDYDIFEKFQHFDNKVNAKAE